MADIYGGWQYDPELVVPEGRERDLESWLSALKFEYVAGDLTIEEFEAEVERYLKLYEDGPPPPVEGQLYYRTDDTLWMMIDGDWKRVVAP